MLTTNPTMTSREIADLVESRHDKVKQSIERLAERGIFQLPPLGEVRNHLGQTVSEYLVGKRESYIVVAQLCPEFTARLVDRWQELESRVAVPAELSRMELIQIAMQAETERLALTEKIAADAPKVQFAEVIRATDGVCLIGDFCKTMKAGRNNLFKRMRADKILLSTNLPYQRYIDKGYFSVIEQAPYVNKKGETRIKFTTMVTGAGQVFLTRRYADMNGST